MMNTYLEVRNDPIVIPQGFRVLFFEKGGGLLSCSEARVGIIEVIGVSVTPSWLNRSFQHGTLGHTDVTHQLYTVPAAAVCSG